MFGNIRLRWKVKINHVGGSPDRDWNRITNGGPWYVTSEDPPGPGAAEQARLGAIPYEEEEDDPFSEGWEPPEYMHVCNSQREICLREEPSQKPKAVFDAFDYRIGLYTITVYAWDRPGRRNKRPPREIELVLEPDRSNEAAKQLGLKEHPYNRRADESKAAVSELRHRR